MAALGTVRRAFLRSWRLLAIDGFEVDLPGSKENIAEFGYAGSGENRSAFPKARVVALSECGTHAFLAAEIDAYQVGEKTLAQRLYPRLRRDELLTADETSTPGPRGTRRRATGAALVWRAPTSPRSAAAAGSGSLTPPAKGWTSTTSTRSRRRSTSGTCPLCTWPGSSSTTSPTATATASSSGATRSNPAPHDQLRLHGIVSRRGVSGNPWTRAATYRLLWWSPQRWWRIWQGYPIYSP